jgi:hypothetical protein
MEKRKIMQSIAYLFLIDRFSFLKKSTGINFMPVDFSNTILVEINIA